jgi:outer membrane protein, heavy metal efflux system
MFFKIMRGNAVGSVKVGMQLFKKFHGMCWLLVLMQGMMWGGSGVKAERLEDLIREAYSNNPELLAAWHRMQAMGERVTQEGGLPDPQISYGYFIQRMDTRQRIEISQMLPGPGKRGLRRDIATGEASGAEYELNAVAAEVRANVMKAYAEHLAVSRSIQYMQENFNLLEDLNEIVSQRYQTGSANRADLLRLSMEAATVDAEIETMRDRLHVTKAVLNAQLGRDTGADLNLSEDISEFLMADMHLNEAMLRLRSHPELQRRANAVGVAAGKRELSNRDSRPDWMVGVEFMDNRGMARDEVMAMVSINLPVWRGRYAAARRQADAELRAAEYEYRAGVSVFEAETSRRLAELRDARRRYHLNSNLLLPQAEEVWEVVEAGYRTGRSDFQELLDVLRVVIQLRLEQVRLEGELFQRYAEWEQFTGPFDYEKNNY